MINKIEKKVDLRNMTPMDWPEVRAIYEEGIATGIATFETDIPEWSTWDHEHLSHSRIVAIVGDRIMGWIALAPVSGRCAYQGVGEISIYITAEAKGHGIAKTLMEAAIASSEEYGIWTLFAAMTATNLPSIRFHEKIGFRRIGYREKIGKMDGEWQDIIIFERRSPNIF
ncbi:MAG: N-acetyltransferase family protein [Cyclobacteriaceae bacterium]